MANFTDIKWFYKSLRKKLWNAIKRSMIWTSHRKQNANDQ